MLAGFNWISAPTHFSCLNRTNSSSLIVSTVVAGILILAPRKMGSAVQWTAARKIQKNFKTQVEMSLRDSCLMAFVNRTNLAPYLDCKKSGGWLLFCLCKDNSLKVRQKRFYITQHDDPSSLEAGKRMSSGSTLAQPFLSIHSFSLSFIQGPSVRRSPRKRNKGEERKRGRQRRCTRSQ